MKEKIEFKFSVGELTREKITGFEGVVMSQCHYISGCVQYGILSRELKGGETEKWTYFDEDRLASSNEIIHLLPDEREETPMGGEDVKVSMSRNNPRTN